MAINEEILVNITPQETRVAIVENGALQEVCIERERSLVWIRPDILDDPARISLARVMAAAAEDHDGGHLFDVEMRTHDGQPIVIEVPFWGGSSNSNWASAPLGAFVRIT